MDNINLDDISALTSMKRKLSLLDNRRLTNLNGLQNL